MFASMWDLSANQPTNNRLNAIGWLIFRNACMCLFYTIAIHTHIHRHTRRDIRTDLISKTSSNFLIRYHQRINKVTFMICFSFSFLFFSVFPFFLFKMIKIMKLETTHLKKIVSKWNILVKSSWFLDRLRVLTHHDSLLRNLDIRN